MRKAADSVGTTALVYAIINAHYDLAAMLLEQGANPNIVDHERDGGALCGGRDEQPAVGAEPAGAHLDATPSTRHGLVKRLLQHGADPNAKLKAAPMKSSTTLAPRSTSAAARRR